MPYGGNIFDNADFMDIIVTCQRMFDDLGKMGLPSIAKLPFLCIYWEKNRPLYNIRLVIPWQIKLAKNEDKHYV